MPAVWHHPVSWQGHRCSAAVLQGPAHPVWPHHCRLQRRHPSGSMLQTRGWQLSRSQFLSLPAVAQWYCLCSCGCRLRLRAWLWIHFCNVYPIPGRAAPDVAVSPQCCWKILHKIMIHNNCKSHGSKVEQGRNSDQNKNQVKTQIQITRSHKLWRIRETFLVPPILHLTPPPAPGEGCVGDVRQCVRQSTFHFNLSVVNFYELAWPRLAQDRATCSNTLTICTRGVNKISRSISQ